MSTPRDLSPLRRGEAIWYLFGAALQLQRRRRENPESVPDELESLGREIDSSLAELETEITTIVESAPHDDDVSQRLENALRAIGGLKDQIAYALGEEDRERACTLLENAIASNLSGLSIRMQESPLGLLAPPAEDDLRPLHGDEFDPSIAACAEDLGRDARRIYEFVATAIDHAIYAGHFRAPSEALSERIANDADQAGLLVELLRASGIRARLVSGPMRLTQSMAAMWLDLSDPVTIERCLRDAGYTVMSWDGGQTFDVFEHFRVRAFLFDAWVDLDSCVRPLEIEREGSRAWTKLPWTPAELEMEYLTDAAAAGGPLAFYEERLGANDGDLRMRRRAAAGDPFPPALAYETPGFAHEQTSFEPGQEHAIRIVLSGPAGQLIDHRFPTPGHCRDAIALRYVPATPTAEALVANAGGALAAPSFALDLRPRLESMNTIIEGTGSAPAGTPLLCQITVENPTSRLTRSSQARPECGTEWVLAFEGPGALLHEAIPLRRTPLTTAARSRLDLVEPLIRAYHRRLSHAASRIAAITDAIGTSGPLVTFAAASNETLSIGGVPIRQRTSSFLIDVRNIELHLYDSTGASSLDPFVELFLSEGSYHEAHCLIDHLGVASTSTVVALREAGRQSNPLRVLTPETESGIDALEYPDPVKNALRVALGITGRVQIIIPQRPVGFGQRQVAAWIARGGYAPTSDYAIAGLSGGIGDNGPHPPPPPPKPKHVHIVDLPKEKLADARKPVSLAALAYDDDNNDLTPGLSWRATLPGSGAGGAATYTPESPGRYVVVASLGGEGLRDGEGGGASDSMDVVVWDVKIEKLVFDESPEMHYVVGEGEVKQYDKVHYEPERSEPPPAAIVAGQLTKATIELNVDPMTSDPAKLTIEGKGKPEKGDDLFEIKGVWDLEGPYRGKVPLEVKAANAIGIAHTIDWKFTIEPDHVIETSTKVRVFVTAGPSKEILGHRFDDVFECACSWASEQKPSDTLGILQALLAKRGLSGLRFSYNTPHVGTFLEGMLSQTFRSGECPEFGQWFLALGFVHGIEGQIYHFQIVPIEGRTDDEHQQRWTSMRVMLRGLNNDPDDWHPESATKMVAPGKYLTNNTDPSDLIPVGTLKAWRFNHHYTAVFEVNGVLSGFDGSMDEGATFVPPVANGPYELPHDHPFRVGYVGHLAAYFEGNIKLADGTIEHVLVPAKDALAQRECVKFEFTTEDPKHGT